MQSFYGPEGRWRPLADTEIDKLSDLKFWAYLHGLNAAEAVSLAASAFKTELDYSKESIGRLDDILRRFRRRLKISARALDQGRISDEYVQRMSSPWGGYLAEVLRLELGARYINPMKNKHQLTQSCNGLQINTTNKVWKRLVYGPADDLLTYVYLIENFQKLKDQES